MPRYQIFIKQDLITELETYIYKVYAHKEIFILTDEHVFDLYKEKMVKVLPHYTVKWCVIKPGEEAKSMDIYQDVIHQLIALGIKRNHLILALGGGVIGDLSGFVAATLYRGLPYIQIPTSLLAQVDSSVGGKVGINLAEGKNLLGSFYQPKAVLIDPTFLKTLPAVEYTNGLAEMIKCGLIADKKLFNHFLTHDKVTETEIARAISVKRKLVLKDPFDQYERMLLNFGHTFGHAIEKQSAFAIKHGYAVSHGMLIALKLGIKLGYSDNVYQEVKQVLNRLKLVEDEPLDYHTYINSLSTDKKNLADGFRFVYLEKIGKSFIGRLDVTKL